MFLLGVTGLFDNHVRIQGITIHQVIVTNKPRPVFKHEYQPSELIRFARLAATI